jgi:5-methylthioadenosine/S-adenosylhomocysteine deaminase
METPKSRERVDVLIKCKYLIPIVPCGAEHKDYAIAIRNQRIAKICPQIEASRLYEADKEYDLRHHLVMPGLVNAQVCASMRLLKGLACNLKRLNWLTEFVRPLEKKILNPDFVGDGTKLAISEMIKSGTTCYADMYFLPSVAASTANEIGMRSQIGFPVLDEIYGENTASCIHEGLKLHDSYKNQALTKVAFAIDSLNMLDQETLEIISTYADELDLPIRIRLQETESETTVSFNRFGSRPVDRLVELGMLHPQTQLTHMLKIDANDIQPLRRHGCQVVACPESNVKLNNGMCPIEELIFEGINVALGTESAGCNTSLDLLGGLKTINLLIKGSSKNSSFFDAHQSLKMATLDGAKALNWQDQIGSLESGKFADIIAIDVTNIDCFPTFDMASGIVYGSSGPDVTHCWVGGKALMENSILKNISESELMSISQKWSREIDSA